MFLFNNVGTTCGSKSKYKFLNELRSVLDYIYFEKTFEFLSYFEKAHFDNSHQRSQKKKSPSATFSFFILLQIQRLYCRNTTFCFSIRFENFIFASFVIFFVFNLFERTTTACFLAFNRDPNYRQM